MADEALARLGFTRGGSQLRLDPKQCKSLLKPLVDAAVAFGGWQRVPPVARREGEGVGPIGVMRHQPTGGGTAHQRAEMGQGRYLGEFLKVTKRGGRLSPAVETEYGAFQSRHGLEQR